MKCDLLENNTVSVVLWLCLITSVWREAILEFTMPWSRGLYPSFAVIFLVAYFSFVNTLFDVNHLCELHRERINGSIYDAAEFYWPLESSKKLVEVKSCSFGSVTQGEVFNVSLNHAQYGVYMDASTSVNLGSFSAQCISDPSKCYEGMSVSFWLKAFNVSQNTEEDKYQFLVGTRRHLTGFGIYQKHFVDGNSNRIVVVVQDENTRVEKELNIIKEIWTHVGFTWKKGGFLTLFINGIKKSETAVIASTNPVRTYPLVLSFSVDYTQSSSTTRAYNMLSDLAVWYKELDAEAVYQAFNTTRRCRYISPAAYTMTTSSGLQWIADRGTLQGSWAWCAKDHAATQQILQFQFNKLTYICSIITKGNPLVQGEYVTGYRLSWTSDGRIWTQQSKNYSANVDSNDEAIAYLSPPAAATAVQLYPQGFVGRQCLNIGLTGFDKVSTSIKILTEGYNDPGVHRRKPYCSIKVDGREVCPGGIGHNFVILNPSTGDVVATRTFHTANITSNVSQEMAGYIYSLPPCAIIIIAVTGTTSNVSEAWHALYSIGGTDSLFPGLNYSWILLGRVGGRKPWVQQINRSPSMGPAVLDVSIELEENAQADHFWKLDYYRADKRVLDLIGDLHGTVNSIPNGCTLPNLCAFRSNGGEKATINPIAADKCLVDPENCPGGISVSFWANLVLDEPPSLSNPEFKVSRTDEARCYTWLTTSNDCCVFPFKYKNKQYHSCTTFDHYRLWCASTSDYDRDEKWGNCLGCNRPLVATSRIKSSSDIDSSHSHNHARLGSPSYWRPATNNGSEYLQVNLLNDYHVTAIGSQGSGVDAEKYWVYSYELYYSYDKITFSPYSDESMRIKTFVSNNDGTTEVVKYLAEPIQCRSVRIHPNMWHDAIAMRVEVYGCPVTPLNKLERTGIRKDCHYPLVENTALASRLMNSSSFNGENCLASFAVLNGPKSWCPVTQNVMEHLTVRFQEDVVISAIASQGADQSGTSMYVASYKLTHSIDGHEWSEYSEFGVTKVFEGNSDSSGIVTHGLKYNIDARFVRLNPLTWSSAGIAMRIEVYGCLRDNPKFRVVGKQSLDYAKDSKIEVAYRVCREGITCPNCTRQVYLHYFFGGPVHCLNSNVSYSCRYVVDSRDLLSNHRFYFDRIKMFDAHSSSCELNPLPLMYTPVAVSYRSGYQEPKSRESCLHHLLSGQKQSGYYWITPSKHHSRKSMLVYCDQTTSGGGWTVIQRRHNGSVDFDRDWQAYKVGFGAAEGEYWVGTDMLHYMTKYSSGQYIGSELRVDVESLAGMLGEAEYKHFNVGPETNNYLLEVRNYTGTIGDALSYHDNSYFSTKDRDEDSGSRNCANEYKGGWWYNQCLNASLNAPYLQTQLHPDGYDGIRWKSWGSNVIKKVEMKVRPGNIIRCNAWACFYFLQAAANNINDAQQKCTLLGGQPLSVHSEIEWLFVKSFISEADIFKTKTIFTGLNDREQDGELRWMDGSRYDYNIPYFLNTSAGSCYVVKHEGDRGYFWTEHSCGERGSSVICKRGIMCHQSECFYDFRHENAENWENNKAKCENHGSQLAKIYNKKKNDFFSGILRKTGSSMHIALEWGSEGFKWLDGRVPNFTKSNYQSHSYSKQCWTIDPPGIWNMESCGTNRKVICERPYITASSCDELLSYGVTASGEYAIYPRNRLVYTYCDMDNDGGGWEVIQRRVNGSENFNRTWDEYENGFGTTWKEFWLGNSNIRLLTNEPKTLLVKLVTNSGYTAIAYYHSFQLLGTSNTLHVSEYSGTAGDSLGYHNNRKFTTFDKDQDSHNDNCAVRYGGGWWYGGCHTAHLNGQYKPSIGNSTYAIYWKTLGESVKYVEMKIKSFPTDSVDRGNILLTGAEQTNFRGLSLHMTGTSLNFSVATATKRWELTFCPFYRIWTHCTVTWSPVSGLKYYENGVLTASSIMSRKFKATGISSEMTIGTTTSNIRSTRQIFHLATWKKELRPSDVLHNYQYQIFTFDNDWEFWTHTTSDDGFGDGPFLSWIRRNGPTPSYRTGPPYDSTTKNPLGSYLYMEASSPLRAGNSTYITSVLLKFPFRCLRFRYHMLGEDMGRLEVKFDQRTPLWTVEGNLGNTWRQAIVPLLDMRKKLTFIATRGSGIRSDVAIDDVSLSMMPCAEREPLTFRRLGCYKTAFEILDKIEPVLDGSHNQRKNAIHKCAQAAHKRGYRVFGLSDGGYCRSRYNAHLNYDVAFNPKDPCPEDGEGAHSSMDVYAIDECFPPCPHGYECDPKTLLCKCGQMNHFTSSCQTDLKDKVFLDAAHYWPLDNLSVVDVKGGLLGGVTGIAESVLGVVNNASQVSGTASWIFLGRESRDEEGFEFFISPSLGEKPRLSIRIVLKNQSCLFGLPYVPGVWTQVGFSYADASSLDVYQNGNKQTYSVQDTCSVVITTPPASSILRTGEPILGETLALDEVAVWYKRVSLSERYTEVKGSTQAIQVAFKFSSMEWTDDYLDLESLAAVTLTSSINDEFKKILGSRFLGIHIHGFTNGSVNVNMSIIFGAVNYTDILLLEEALYQNVSIMSLPISGASMSSATVPLTPPMNITVKVITPFSVNVSWASDNATTRLIQGYRILYKRIGLDSLYSLHTVQGLDSHAVVEGLSPATNYTFRLLAYSLKGDGFISPPIYGMSGENVPQEVPNNITSVATNSTALNVTWAHINALNWYGNPLGYVINYSAPEVPADPWINITVAPDNSSVLLVSLRKYKVYCVTIAAYNRIGSGNFSEPVCVRTLEDVPDAPLQNIKIAAANSTALSLTADEIPFLNQNGIILGCVANWSSLYGEGSLVFSNCSGMVITGLRKYTEYSVMLYAFNKVGPSPWGALLVRTAEDVPTAPPESVSGHNISSTAISVSWSEVPEDHKHGVIRGYKVWATRIETGEIEKMMIVCMKTANVTGLYKYREYNVTVAAITSIGIGPPATVFIWTDQDTPSAPPPNITAVNTSSTTVELSWSAVPYEHVNGIILGYKIQQLSYTYAYKSGTDNTEVNMTVHGADTLQRTLTPLEMYSDYTYRVCAFTIKGDGNWSDHYYFRTDEDAPLVAPVNLTANSSIWHSIELNWTSIPSHLIPGICRGYRVSYKLQQVAGAGELSLTLGADATTIVVDDLSGFMWYDLKVVAFTVKDGPVAKTSVQTKDYLPKVPPPSFRGQPISSTRLRLQWEPVPLLLTNGEMVGYILEYNNTNKSIADNATYPTIQTEVTLVDLHKFNYYQLRIVAYNVMGFGPWSDYITLRTDEDVPERPPANSSGNADGPTSIFVEWKPVPFDYRNGFITGYKLIYRAVSSVGRPLYGEPSFQLLVGPHVLDKVIQNLKTFTTYEVQVIAQTIKGDSEVSTFVNISTCRCHRKLSTNWRIMAPYVTYDNSSDTPRGMFPYLLETSIEYCCGRCSAHGKTIIDFNTDGFGEKAMKNKDIDVKRAIDQVTDLSFPINGYKDQTHYSKYFGYMPVVTTPGVLFIVSRAETDASPQNVALTVFMVWPFLLVNITLALLFAFVIWFTESNSNEDQFPPSFARGIGSGFWFAFVTMTTVGYGDKTAVTFVGRVLTIAWTLVGLVTFSILMGSLSASFEILASTEIESGAMLYGTKVAALDNSSEHRLGLRKNAKVNDVNRYKTLEEIQEALLSGEVKGALIDAYVVGANKHMFNHSKLRVNKVIEISSVYGVVLGGPTIKIQECLRHYFLEQKADISAHIRQNADSLESPDKSIAGMVTDDMFDSSSNVFIESLWTIMYMFVGLFVLGMLYELAYQLRKRRRSTGIKELEDLILRKQNMQSCLRDLVEGFKNNMEEIWKNLTAKHLSERKRLLRLKRERNRTFKRHSPYKVSNEGFNEQDQKL
ncbi:uncharacterized protein LOC5521276 isoform X2 [Nematostella vectensis]|uniref:uncharacterized protein LOC5521276 isoform X2 n=1 Tax=Nematostella vectensis TaxID=45351 RepID=UPI0020772CC4|nr:uncharacterized protein LOC5521276 isoform X2 [Nematostella vectensis]